MGVQVPTGTRVEFRNPVAPFALDAGRIVEHKIVKRTVWIKSHSNTGRTKSTHEIHRYRVRLEGRNARVWLDRGDFEIMP